MEEKKIVNKTTSKTTTNDWRAGKTSSGSSNNINFYFIFIGLAYIITNLSLSLSHSSVLLNDFVGSRMRDEYDYLFSYLVPLKCQRFACVCVYDWLFPHLFSSSNLSAGISSPIFHSFHFSSFRLSSSIYILFAESAFRRPKLFLCLRLMYNSRISVVGTTLPKMRHKLSSESERDINLSLVLDFIICENESDPKIVSHSSTLTCVRAFIVIAPDRLISLVLCHNWPNAFTHLRIYVMTIYVISACVLRSPRILRP